MSKVRTKVPIPAVAPDTPKFQDCPAADPYYKKANPLEVHFGNAKPGAPESQVLSNLRKMMALHLAQHNRPATMAPQLALLFESMLGYTFGKEKLTSALPSAVSPGTQSTIRKVDLLKEPVINVTDPTKSGEIVPALHLSDTYATTLIASCADDIRCEVLVLLLHARFASIGLDEMTLQAVKSVPMYWTGRMVFGDFGAFHRFLIGNATMTNEKDGESILKMHLVTLEDLHELLVTNRRGVIAAMDRLAAYFKKHQVVMKSFQNLLHGPTLMHIFIWMAIDSPTVMYGPRENLTGQQHVRMDPRPKLTSFSSRLRRLRDTSTLRFVVSEDEDEEDLLDFDYTKDVTGKPYDPPMPLGPGGRGRCCCHMAMLIMDRGWPIIEGDGYKEHIEKLYTFYHSSLGNLEALKDLMADAKEASDWLLAQLSTDPSLTGLSAAAHAKIKMLCKTRWTGHSTACNGYTQTWAAITMQSKQPQHADTVLNDPVCGPTDRNYGIHCFCKDHYVGSWDYMIRTLQTTSRSLTHKVAPLFRDWRMFVGRYTQQSPIYGPCFEAYVELMESEGKDDLVEELKELHLQYFVKIEEAYDEYLTPWLPYYDAAACIDPRCTRSLDNDAFLAMKDLFTLFGGDYAQLKVQALRYETTIKGPDAQTFGVDDDILPYYRGKVEADRVRWEPLPNGGPDDGFNQFSYFALVIITIQWENVLCESTNSYDKLNRGQKGGRRSRLIDTNMGDRLHCRDARRNWQPGMPFLDLG